MHPEQGRYGNGYHGKYSKTFMKGWVEIIKVNGTRILKKNTRRKHWMSLKRYLRLPAEWRGMKTIEEHSKKES